MKNNQLPELPVAWESISSVLESLARSTNEVNRRLARRVQAMIRADFYEAATRELGPEAVSAVELVFAEPVVERRRYVKRSRKTTEPTAPQSGNPVDRALKKVLAAVERAVAEVEEEAQNQESEVAK